nr:PDZ domain-containing protein [candidate division Zixibacteria bacterium]
MKTIFSIAALIILAAGSVSAQNFNFDRIYQDAEKYTVAVDLVIEVSFGMQTTEAESRGIGAVVSSDGLVLFDGTSVNSDDPLSAMAGMQVSAEPKSIEITMMDGTKYPAEFIGVDRFTKIGFCRITASDNRKFDYVKFRGRGKFRLGEWLLIYYLLPDFVTPDLGADIGLVSANISAPEEFVLTVGFNSLQLTSIMYDTSGNAVGVLGNLENPALSGFDASRMMESFSQFDDFMPLLGLIDAERLNKLIENPPKQGKVDRGWLGIYLQALTSDIAEFWGITSPGGIIVNEVVKDSPADSAGIKTGDIIISLQGTPIEVNKEDNLPIFQKKISEMGAGVPIDFEILRRLDGQIDTLDIHVILAQAPISPAEAPDYENDDFELTVRDMVFADYSVLNLERSFKGVVVKEVEPGGWASVGGMFPGDIIQSIGGEKITSVIDAKTAFARLAQDKPEEAIFFIYRDSKTLFVNIKTDW